MEVDLSFSVGLCVCSVLRVLGLLYYLEALLELT